MFNLASPWFLILMPLPLIIRALLPAASPKSSAVLKIPFYDRIQSIKLQLNPANFRLLHKKLLLPFIIWCLLCIAISGPQWLDAPLEFPQSGRDIMLALDLSGSMQTADMELNGSYFSRLSVVKIAARSFIEARKGDRLGLILFGTHAYLQTPLTFDQQTILQMLDDATIGLAGSQTAIGDALGLALKQLSQAPGDSKAIILLTDGGNNAGSVSPLDAAMMAKQMGIAIYTIGIGAEQLIVQGVFGPQMIHPTNDVDEAMLKQIAHVTGGIFFRASNAEELQQIYQQINKLVPVTAASSIFRPIKPLYPWPLGLALFLSVYMFLMRLNFFRFKERFNDTA